MNFRRACNVLRHPLWISITAVVAAWVAATTNASADDLWKHPDPRFAAIDEAVDDDKYSTAQKLLGDLRGEAKRRGEGALEREVLERGKEVTRLARDFDKISKHLKTLKRNPKDRKAALAAGKFYCVTKGDFGRGLPLLAAGDDSRLAEVAAADQERVDTTDRQLAIAGHWWQCAEATSDIPERATWQIRAREWMLRARPASNERQRATIDQRLNQVVLMPERIVVWNTHNGPPNDRGAEEISVSLLHQGAVVWQETAALPFKANEPSAVLLRPKRVRADQVRVEVTRYHKHGGGLGEIEVFVGRTNIAAGCRPIVDAHWQENPQYAPANLVDGDRSGASGFWLTDDGKPGWTAIHFSDLGGK